jgi:hypothetical protein
MLSRPGPVPPGSGWSFELEWDGFRAIVSAEDGLRVRSRRGWNMTAVLPELGGLPAGLVLDGELVAWKGSQPYFPHICRRVLSRHVGADASGLLLSRHARDGLTCDRALSPVAEDAARELPHLAVIRRLQGLGTGSPAFRACSEPNNVKRLGRRQNGGRLDPDAYDIGDVTKRRFFQIAVDRRARVCHDGHLQAEFARGDGGLRHATLRSHSCDEQPFAVEIFQDEVEGCVIEGGVARFDHESFPCSRRDGTQERAAGARDSTFDQPRCIAVPYALVVVGKNDGYIALTDSIEQFDESAVALAKRLEQPHSLLVLEVVEHIDQKKNVTHGRSRYPRPLI